MTNYVCKQALIAPVFDNDLNDWILVSMLQSETHYS